MLLKCRLLLILLALTVAARVAWAQTLVVTPENEELAARLQLEALVLQAEDGTEAGDLIATARGDYERLVAALYAEGYFSASVSIQLAGREASGLNAFNPPAELAPIVIAVDLGRRFTFGRAEITPVAPDAVGVEGFAPGAPAGTATIVAAGSQAIADWRAASHAKAEITGQQIIARHRDGELDVALTVDPGPALTFGDLVLPPDPPVRPDRILQIAGLPTGDPFDPAAVALARTRLVATGAFNAVVVSEAEEVGPDNTLDILLGVEAAKPRRLGFGAEVDSTDGLNLQAFWMHRNILGGAERLRFDLEVDGIGGGSGGTDFKFSGGLRIPGYRRPDDTLELGFNLEDLDQENFDEQLIEVGVRRSRKVNETLEVSGYAALRVSEATDAFGTNQFQHILLSASATRDFRDDQLNPRNGTYGALELRPFIAVGQGDTGFRIEGDFRAYRALGESTVAAGRLQLASVLFAGLEGTPPEFLFFSGGGGTVRGQAFESLGIEVSGDTTGGRGFAGLSLELRQDITESIGVVGFFDYGYVTEDGTFEGGDGHAGGGVGLRYNTALGPLRVDVGVPVGDASDEDTDYALYIGLGQAF